MTNKERLELNNQKIEQIQETLKSKILKASGDGEYFVKVIDYDGTILKETRLNTGDTFELPTPPSHDGLVFQEWSCSQEIIDNTITITDNNVMIGATYTTASGLSEFDIELTKTIEPDIATNGLYVKLGMDGTKDWGDGTSDDLTYHYYTNYGKYTIKCNGTNLSTSGGKSIFASSSSDIIYRCKNVRLANITNIPTYAFYNCRNLQSITIPKGVTSIGTFAFNNCWSLLNVTIPNGVSSCGEYSFYDCRKLITVILPYSVTFIANRLFQTCHVLKNIVIPNNVTGIGEYAFQNCWSLTDVVIPNKITNIKMQAFERCQNITDIVIPNGVITINAGVFDRCYNLKHITLHDNLIGFGSSAFDECYSLIGINIPNSVKSFGGYTFNYCYSLTHINIPSGVTKINNSEFINCINVETFDFSTHAAVPTLSNTNAFSGISKTAKIIVPDALYDEWIVATNWATYADYIYKESEV